MTFHEKTAPPMPLAQWWQSTSLRSMNTTLIGFSPASPPSLTLLSLISNDDVVAAELREVLTVERQQRSFNIAVFFDVSGGVIHRATVYREGTADIELSGTATRWRPAVRTQ